MEFVYVIGEPGSGKSTLVSTLVRDVSFYTSSKPLAHIIYEPPSGKEVIEIGAVREQFRGTDALAMDAINKAIPFVQSHPAEFMLAEGDRLANDRFFQAVQDAGYDLEVIWLDPPAGITWQRRQQRAEEVGKAQNESWVAGRRSKVVRLAEAWGAHIIKTPDLVQATRDVDALGTYVLQMLRGERTADV